MVIQHNLTAFNSNRQLGITTGLQAKSSEKLSSGYKINRAADDAAGLAISEKMRRLVRGLDQASYNIQDGISLVQIADGALAESLDNLQRVNELAVKAANDTLTPSDRSYIQAEVSQLLKEVDRTAHATTFNDSIYPLLSGGIVKELPAGLTNTSVTVTYSGTATAIYNGQSYGPGSSFTANDVLTTPDGLKFIASHVADGGGHGGAHGIFDTQMGLPERPALITKLSLDDVKEDSNGYLYIDDNEYWGKLYLTTGHYTSSPYSESDVPNLLKMKQTVVEGEPLYIQAGAESDDTIEITLVNATAASLGVDPLHVSTQGDALESIEKVKSALLKISGYRSDFGAMQNRLEHAYKNVTNIAENTQDAESLIRDTDMASEMVKYSNNNILMQAGQSMLAQANQTNQGVLSLLQ